MTTALQIIERAYRTIGVLASGETASDDLANDGLVYLNDVLAGLSNESLIIYADTLDSIALTGATSYTFGDGGVIDSDRPTVVKNVYFRNTDGIDYPVQMITSDQYDSIYLKTVSTGIPTCVFITADWPLANVFVWPVASAGTLFFMSNKPLTYVSSLTTDISLPIGYDRLLRYCLAAEMMPEYGINNPQVIGMMNDAKSKIKRTNMSNSVLQVNLPYGNSNRSGYISILSDGMA